MLVFLSRPPVPSDVVIGMGLRTGVHETAAVVQAEAKTWMVFDVGFLTKL